MVPSCWSAAVSNFIQVPLLPVGAFLQHGTAGSLTIAALASLGFYPWLTSIKLWVMCGSVRGGGQR